MVGELKCMRWKNSWKQLENFSLESLWWAAEWWLLVGGVGVGRWRIWQMTNVKPIRGHEQVSQGCSFYTFFGTLVTKADFPFFFIFKNSHTASRRSRFFYWHGLAFKNNEICCETHLRFWMLFGNRAPTLPVNLSFYLTSPYGVVNVFWLWSKLWNIRTEVIFLFLNCKLSFAASHWRGDLEG